MEAFIARYGLLAVLVGAAVEGDVTLILAGVTAHLGLLRFPVAIGVGILGGMLADCVCYSLGRRRAAAMSNAGAYRRVAHLIERLAERLGPWEIVIARFVYGTRIASMVLWGMQRLPFGRFVVLDLLGCTLWAVVLGGLGFVFSGSVEALIGRVRRMEIWLLFALVFTGSAVLIVRGLMRCWVRGHQPGRGR